jgi:flagellar hook-basal body complex protein FliE
LTALNWWKQTLKIIVNKLTIGDEMINNDRAVNLIQQMQSLESAAKSQLHVAEMSEPKGPGFGELMEKAINQVNQTQMKAGELSKAFEMGDSNVGLAEVMIAIQKSRVSFEALSQVRNKLLTAYQDVMNMPV